MNVSFFCTDANKKALASRAGCFDVVAEAIEVHQRDSAFVSRAIHAVGVFGIDGIRLLCVFPCVVIQLDAVNCV